MYKKTTPKSQGDDQKLTVQDLHQDLLQGDVEEGEGGDPEWDDLKSLVWMEVREDGQLLEFSSYQAIHTG